MAKIKWLCEEVHKTKDGRVLRLYARSARGEIVVRVENDENTTEYAEWGYPKLLGIGGSIQQAILETRPADIRP